MTDPTTSTTVEVYTKDAADTQVNAAKTYTYRKVAAEEKAREAADTEIKQDMTDQKTSTALHVSKDGNLIVGTKENQIVKNMKINGQLTSGSISTGDITSSGDVTVTGKMAADGVTDETTKDGTYIKQNNTVGNNLVSLDTQVKANADAINEEARKRKYSVTNLEKADAAEAATREAKDNELNERITNEANAIHDEIKAGDKVLDDRITNVKEYLETQTSENYVSKTDASVQDAGVVKANKKIGENVTALGKGLYDETAARIGADAAQDKVIQQVNDNLVQSVNTINKNVADGFTALNQAGANEAAAREAKDNELNERITNEANAIHETTNKLQDDLNTETTAREVADTALDTRITNVKEYLEKQTSDKYVSKADAAVQDGAIVKADKTIGENVTNLDAALAKETAARLGADKAQDKVIQQVNDNAAAGIKTLTEAYNNEVAARQSADTTLQTNIDNEAAERKAADTVLDDKIMAETSARVAADTKLVEAVNSGVSLSNDNILQKNTTTIDAQGNVTTSKTDANEMILNKGKDNQITLSENGIKVGLNSGVMDKDGFYAGGDTYSEAKAALKSDGSIKGADGKFTVNSANGTVSVNDQIELNGATGVVKSNGLNVGDGNFTVNNNGGVKAADGKITLNSEGSVKAADGKFTVNSNGGVTAADGKITLSSDGSVKAANGNFTVNSNGGVTAADGKITLNSDGSLKAADGKFTVDTNGAVKTANGNTTIDSNGNVKTVGTLSAADGSFKVDSTGKITSTGLDAGNGTIQTTGRVQAGDVKTGTLETTGDATIGGDLTVNGKLNVDEIDLTKSGIVGDNNVTASTKVAAGEITGYKKATSTKDGSEKESAIDYDENGTSTWAKAADKYGNWNKSTLTVEGSDVTSEVVDSEKNSNLFTQTASESSSVVSGKDGEKTYKSYITQNMKKILQKIEDGDGHVLTSTEQTETDITNTAKNGTIANDAGKLVNTASGTIANMAGNDITNTSTNGNIANTAANGTISNNAKNLTNTASENITNKAENGNISNIASNGTISNEAKTISNKATEALTNDAKNITNKASESVTTQIGDGSAVKSVMNGNGIANTATDKAITNDAATITNTGTTSVTNQVGNNKVLVDTTHVQSAFGDTIYTTWDESGITNNATDKTVATNAKNIQNTATGDITNTAEKGTITNKAQNLVNDASVNMTTTVGGEMKTTVTGKVTEDYKSDLDTKVGGNETHYVKGNQTNTVSGNRTVNVKGTETENFNALETNVKTDQKTSVGGNQTTIVTGNQTNNVSGSKTETVKGSVTEKYGSQATTVDGDQSTNIGGNQTTVVAKDQTNTVSGNKTETVKGAVNETYGSQTTKVNGDQSTTVTGKQTNSITGDQVNTIGGNQTTTVTGDSSLSAKNITNTASEKITNQIGDGSAVKSEMTADGITNTAEGGTIYNKSKDILNEVSGDILNFADGEIGNSATKITNLTGDNTVTSDTNGTTFENKAHSTAIEEGSVTKTTISGNTLETGKATMDYAEVMKDLGVRGNAAVDGNTTLGKEGAETTLTVNSTSTFKKDVTMKENAAVEKDLAVKGNTKLDGTLEVGGKSTFKDDVTMEKNLDVKGTTTTAKLVVNNGATVTGGTTTDTLHVTSTATFDDIVTMKKDLSVGGNVDAASYTVKGTGIKIDENGINAGGTKVTGLAPADISHAGSTDAVSGGQLYETNTRVSGLETRMGTVETKVDKLDGKIDKVGANAAAMANLHPLEFDEDSKWNVAAAVGSSGSETASAVGVFYRPNENVMVNASAAMGTGENMFGGGVSLRLGHGGNKAKEAQMKAAAAENKELRAKVDDLTARMDALLSVLNPNMSKDFPDVPENHWAYEAVSRLAGNGIVEGYEDGKYHGERQMTRYEMAEIIYNALSKGAKAEKKLVEEFRPELQAMAAQKKA